VSKFGWCMDGNDDKCRVEYTDWLGQYSRCDCDCHPKVDAAHIEAFLEAHPREIEPQLLGAGARKRRTTKSAAPKAAAKPRRQTAAESKALAATEAAIAAIESDESVRERMTELLEEV